MKLHIIDSIRIEIIDSIRMEINQIEMVTNYNDYIVTVNNGLCMMHDIIVIISVL